MTQVDLAKATLTQMDLKAQHNAFFPPWGFQFFFLLESTFLLIHRGGESCGIKIKARSYAGGPYPAL